MSNFATEKIKGVEGKQAFLKLLKNGYCQFDEFVSNLGDEYSSEMDQIYAYMNLVANLETVPESKFKQLEGRKKSDNIKDYEFRSKNLRVYCADMEGGKIVIIGGYKKNQKADIKSLRTTKQQYFND